MVSLLISPEFEGIKTHVIACDPVVKGLLISPEFEGIKTFLEPFSHPTCAY